MYTYRIVSKFLSFLLNDVLQLKLGLSLINMNGTYVLWEEGVF